MCFPILTFVFLLIFGVVLVQAMEFVLSESHKYGLRIILSLANNYENFGGKAQYVQWACKAGENLNFVDDFFTNRTIKGYYKNHVKVNSVYKCMFMFHYMVKFLLLCI